MAKTQQAPEQEERFDIKRAVRHWTPQIVALYGPTFSGKTFGAICLAAGLTEPGAKIGVIDTENGRFSAYADDPDVIAMVPQGFELIELHPPFHPRRYIAANRALQDAGCQLILTDSGSHAWNGPGGGLDMKEKDKNWLQAKLWNKRFKSSLIYSPVHQIVCLRAEDKTKVIDANKSDSGKQEYIPMGIVPECEKSFTYELGTTIEVEGEINGKTATHLARPKKWHKSMNGFFEGWQPQLLTPEIGKRIRQWNNGGTGLDAKELLKKQATAIADEGTLTYEAFYLALSPREKKVLFDTIHEDLKKRAVEADAEEVNAVEQSEENNAKTEN